MERKTVFLGDSMTAGYGVSRGECWVDGLPELAVNRGINGDTTAGMLRRFRAHVLAEFPERVVIMGGLNDLGEGLSWEIPAGNIAKMCAWAQREKIQPIIAICIEPNYDEFLASDWAYLLPGIRSIPQKLAALNDWLRRYADEQNLLCLDFAKEFPRRIPDEYCRYFLDGEHPNRFGHAILREIAREALYS
ncbi:MAG: GDSL-type esterase/lipase family protein [Eubacteriales bacterium]|nr:GDSL-type esterase/lipase family protein [Eubacteriales bacterium]